MANYPNSFDNNTTLPPASGDDAVSVNAAIEVIEVLETTLGLLPRSIYASVRTRLDILEARITNPLAPSPNVLNPFFIGNTGVTITAGNGAPNFSAVPGSLYLREDGYVPTTVYVFSTDGYWHALNLTGGAPNLTLTGDVISSGGTTDNATDTVVQITGSAGQVPINCKVLLQGTILNDGYDSARTTNGSTVTIYTDSAIPAGTCYDFIVTVVGINTALPNPPDVYRADFACTFVNRGGTLFAVGATAVPLNVRTSGAGNTFGGASISTLGTSVIVQAAGLSATTIDWSCSFSRMKVS